MSHARDILTSSALKRKQVEPEPPPLFLSPTAIPLVMDFLEYLYAAIAAVFPLLSGLRENLLHEWTRTLGLVSSTVSRFSIQAGDSGLSLPSATATLDPVTYDLDILDLPPTFIDAYNLPQVDYPTEYHPIFTADPSEQLVDVGNSVQDDVKIGPAQMNAPVSVGCLLERNEEMALPEVPYGISRTVLSEAPLLLSAMNRDIPNPFNVSVGSFPDVSFLACLSDLTTETTTPTAGLDPTENPYRADLGSSLDGPTACKPAMDTYESCAPQLVDTSLPNDEKIPGLVPPEPEYEKTCVTDLACSEDYNVNDIEHILSPRAAEDTEDFEAYEPPSSFPFMHFNNDLGDLLGEDLDDWNWTLVNLQLSQRRSFVCGASNQSAHAQPSEYATANKPNILDGVFPRDLPPRVKIPGLRRPELVACYPFVATRVGIIHHDESFRMYEPPVQLELAVREERRATLLAIQHKKLKKNKSTPNLQRVGLSREAFFAIFLRQSIPRMTLSYADAVRIGLVKQRARMITAPTTDSAKTDPSWARVPNRLVVLNRNRNGQDKNINGDNQIVSRQPHRRASFSGR
ncbi:hypothetical protein EW026_g3067 [Hermanssonia centrifuga]|uniref:Uncharacterized protein n=1 Tax=Hermanssonia centrifuga TaxID=98765 RepID=A0A4S4KL95_9APHY|nr:hypothetical protein EW026_g3067 [Hermanssonia centrifuga]